MLSALAARPRPALAAILILALAVYAPALRNGFVMDGRQLVQIEDNWNPNPLVAELRPIGDYFAHHYWYGVGESSNLYRPVTILSYAVTRAWLMPWLWDHALAQHLVNLLLHAAATLLVYPLLRRAGVAVHAALAGTLVFALHAIHSEVVAGIVGRAELLGFCFGAAGVLLLLHASAAVPRARSVLAMAGAAVAFWMAACAKESALPWPLMAPLVVATAALHADHRVALGPRLRRPLRQLAAVALPAWIAFFALRAAALGGLTESPSVAYALNPLADAGATTRIATASITQVFGLWQTMFPFTLTSDYGAHTFTLRHSLFDPAVLAALLLLLLLIAAAVRLRRSEPQLALAGASFFGFSALTSNLLFPTGTIYAERLYYTPSLATGVLTAWLAGRIRSRRAALLALALWCGTCAAVILQRNPYWRDEPSLFLGDVGVNPHSSRLRVSAANVLIGQGRTEEALAHLRRAVEIAPDHASAWANLAAVLLDRGDRAGGEQALRQGLAARWIQREDATVLHLNLARLLRETGRAREAFELLVQFEQTQPAAPVIYLALLDLAPPQTLPAQRESWIAAGERLAPGEPRWALHRGRIAHAAGEHAAAAAAFERAVAAVPPSALTLVQFAESLAALGRSAESRARFEQALQQPDLEGELRERARRGLAQLPR